MRLFVDIPKPRAWPPPALNDTEAVQKLVAYGYERDPKGDKCHTAFACLFMLCLPLATKPVAVAGWILFFYSLLRLPSTWRTLTPLCRSSIYWSILAWVIWSTLSIAWSSDKTMGVDHASSMWAVSVPVLFWPVMRRWKWLIAAGLIGVFLQNMFQLSEIVASWFLDGNDWISIMKNRFLREENELIDIYLSRPIGLDNHEGNGSLFMAFAAIVWLGILVGKRKYFRLAVFGFLFAVFGTVLALSRAVWTGLILGISTFVILALKNRLISLKFVLITGIAFIVVGAVAVQLTPHHSLSRVLDMKQEITEYFVDGVVRTGIHERLNWYSTEVRQSFEPPILKNAIMGHGLGSTSKIDFSVDGQDVAATTAHPHNSYIQILYEGGLVGLCLFLWMLIKTALSIRVDSGSIGQIVGLSCLVLWSGTAFFDGGQNSGRVLALFVVLATIALFREHVKPTQSNIHTEKIN